MISWLKMHAPGIEPFTLNFSNKRCTSVVDCCFCNNLKIKNSGISKKQFLAYDRNCQQSVASRAAVISWNSQLTYWCFTHVFYKIKRNCKGLNIYGQIMIKFCII